MTALCTVTGCGRPLNSSALCSMHRMRLQRSGTLDQPVRSADPVIRFMAKTDRASDGCLTWIGSRSDTGYGTFQLERRMMPAHRASYLLFVGFIPEGWHIDHLCRKRLCVAPSHLEAVPPSINNARSDSPSAINARKTRCKHGHAFTPENTYRTPRGRHCRACERMHHARLSEKRKLARKIRSEATS